MAKYLMLLHETPGAFDGYSLEENQKVIQKVYRQGRKDAHSRQDA